MPFSCELMPFTAVKTRFTRSPSPLSQVLNYPLELKHSKTWKKKFCPIMYCRSFPFFKACTERTKVNDVSLALIVRLHFNE